jgi:Cdc6-like AAA superfamily ATPase
VDAPVFSENSSLGKNLKEIHSMLHTILRSNGRHGGPIPPGALDCKALYVCGVPGTGKTLSISWLCQYLLELQSEGSIGVEHDDDDERIEWKFLIQNANSVANPSNFRLNIAKTLGLSAKTVAQIERRLKRTGMILVIDEVDAMLQSYEWKILLQELVQYANDPTNRFALIGISNSLMDEKFARIQEMGQVCYSDIVLPGKKKKHFSFCLC